MVTLLIDMRIKLVEQVETIWFVNGREVVYYLYNFGWKCLRKQRNYTTYAHQENIQRNDYEQVAVL